MDGQLDTTATFVRLKALVPVSFVVDKSSDANVSKLMPESKCHQTLFLTQLYAALWPSYYGTHFEDANALASHCLMWAGHW